jgi:hypothetical protein
MTRHDPACAGASTLSQSRAPNDCGEAGGIASFQRGLLTSPSGGAARSAGERMAGSDSIALFSRPLSIQAKCLWYRSTSSSFAAFGARLADNSALVSAGAELHITRSLSLLAKFDGEFARQVQIASGRAILRYSW